MRPMTALKSHLWPPWLLEHIGATVTSVDDVHTSAKDPFANPLLPEEQLVCNYLMDCQIVLHNIYSFIEMLECPPQPAIPPQGSTAAPGTRPIWGE